MSQIKVIGAGLAGCEAAWQLAQRGFSVSLYEMKPQKRSPAHHRWRSMARLGKLSCPVVTEKIIF